MLAARVRQLFFFKCTELTIWTYARWTPAKHRRKAICDGELREENSTMCKGAGSNTDQRTHQMLHIETFLLLDLLNQIRHHPYGAWPSSSNWGHDAPSHECLAHRLFRSNRFSSRITIQPILLFSQRHQEASDSSSYYRPFNAIIEYLEKITCRWQRISGGGGRGKAGQYEIGFQTTFHLFKEYNQELIGQMEHQKEIGFATFINRKKHRCDWTVQWYSRSAYCSNPLKIIQYTTNLLIAACPWMTTGGT